MRKIHAIATITIITLLLSIPSFSAVSLNTAQQKAEKEGIVEIKKVDIKALILARYLESYDSPLQYHAQDFLDAAKTYDLDWKLLPSIAGVESTFGRHIPGGYNAYGWGVYGNNSLGFKSWRDGMFTVAKGLRENYINRGLNNPYSMNRIYASSPVWGGKVVYFMNDLEKFAQKYQMENGIEDKISTTKTAVMSGVLVYKGI